MTSSLYPTYFVFVLYASHLDAFLNEPGGNNITYAICLPLTDSGQPYPIVCSPTSVIHLTNIQRYLMTSLEAAYCLPRPASPSCVSTTYQTRGIYANCSAQSGCNVTIPAGLLQPDMTTNCPHDVNYLQVVYNCLTDIINDGSLTNDICGPTFTLIVSPPAAPFGYITSSNYPTNYPPNTMCSCHLTTNNGSAIILELLDFNVVQFPNDVIPYDWLEFTISGVSEWGAGEKLNFQTGPIFTNSPTIAVNFNSNDNIQARGFWIQYSSQSYGEENSGLISIQCGAYIQPDTKRVISCFEPPHCSELYLTCAPSEVINVVRQRQGRHNEGAPPDPNCQASTEDDVCFVEDDEVDELWIRCMRRGNCLYPAWAITLPSCNMISEYILIDYQCILLDQNTADICGEDLLSGAVLEIGEGIGYINSPLYPTNYPSNTDCYCHLVSLMVDSQIVLFILDVQLADDNDVDNSTGPVSGYSTNGGDVLKYMSDDDVTSVRLNDMKTNTPIYTGLNVIDLHFISDAAHEDRGFWIKYAGRTSDGRNSPVQARCSPFTSSDGGITAPGFSQTPTYRMTSWSANQTTMFRVSGVSGSMETTSKTVGINGDGNPDSSGRSTAQKLIMGFCITIILILLLVIVFSIIVCFRRQATRTKQASNIDISPSGTSRRQLLTFPAWPNMIGRRIGFRGSDAMVGTLTRFQNSIYSNSNYGNSAESNDSGHSNFGYQDVSLEGSPENTASPY